MTAAPVVSAASSVEVFGRFRVRAVGGGPLKGARLFRSCEPRRHRCARGLRARRRPRHPRRVRHPQPMGMAAHAEPCLIARRRSRSSRPRSGRRKDASKRLVAGVIGAYGAPEERMCANYRRYVREYPLIGTALRAIAAEGASALVHCVNGKDRTGVLCAAPHARGRGAPRRCHGRLSGHQRGERGSDRERGRRAGAGMTDAELASSVRSSRRAPPTFAPSSPRWTPSSGRSSATSPKGCASPPRSASAWLLCSPAYNEGARGSGKVGQGVTGV